MSIDKLVKKNCVKCGEELRILCSRTSRITDVMCPACFIDGEG